MTMLSDLSGVQLSTIASSMKADARAKAAALESQRKARIVDLIKTLGKAVPKDYLVSNIIIVMIIAYNATDDMRSAYTYSEPESYTGGCLSLYSGAKGHKRSAVLWKCRFGGRTAWEIENRIRQLEVENDLLVEKLEHYERLFEITGLPRSTNVDELGEALQGNKGSRKSKLFWSDPRHNSLVTGKPVVLLPADPMTGEIAPKGTLKIGVALQSSDSIRRSKPILPHELKPRKDAACQSDDLIETCCVYAEVNPRSLYILEDKSTQSDDASSVDRSVQTLVEVSVDPSPPRVAAGSSHSFTYSSINQHVSQIKSLPLVSECQNGSVKTPAAQVQPFKQLRPVNPSSSGSGDTTMYKYATHLVTTAASATSQNPTNHSSPNGAMRNSAPSMDKTHGTAMRDELPHFSWIMNSNAGSSNYTDIPPAYNSATQNNAKATSNPDLKRPQPGCHTTADNFEYSETMVDADPNNSESVNLVSNIAPPPNKIQRSKNSRVLLNPQFSVDYLHLNNHSSVRPANNNRSSTNAAHCRQSETDHLSTPLKSSSTAADNAKSKKLSTPVDNVSSAAIPYNYNWFFNNHSGNGGPGWQLQSAPGPSTANYAAAPPAPCYYRPHAAVMPASGSSAQTPSASSSTPSSSAVPVIGTATSAARGTSGNNSIFFCPSKPYHLSSINGVGGKASNGVADVAPWTSAYPACPPIPNDFSSTNVLGDASHGVATDWTTDLFPTLPPSGFDPAVYTSNFMAPSNVLNPNKSFSGSDQKSKFSSYYNVPYNNSSWGNPNLNHTAVTSDRNQKKQSFQIAHMLDNTDFYSSNLS